MLKANVLLENLREIYLSSNNNYYVNSTNLNLVEVANSLCLKAKICL